MRTVTKLDNGIIIHGFETLELLNSFRFLICNNIDDQIKYIFDGEISDLTEGILEENEIDNLEIWKEDNCYCGERDSCYYCQNHFDNSVVENIKLLIGDCKYLTIHKENI